MSTVTIMPATDEATLCIKLSGLITKDDYEHNFRQPVENHFSTHDSLRLLIYWSPAYIGWEPEAADRSFNTIIDFGRRSEKIAYVNPPEKKILQVKLSGQLFSGETRFFNEEDLEEAIRWIKS